ncbi:nucleotide exchange factor SIL1 [Sporothrix schenckii 1099-18]|uniref:Nucleotide exchange factor SIL1 n=1 Tax=Sporothrix schenckii 1099-18 TaxID=1397361 RepID=A0A0F2LZ20_SPOSC|nr:nucleotide exchange factor SIL1 [Sporothrix schenckii 1099-18]KJR81750.1 nucleotide exchange factor SIL1 [Sporothrix schenckii 1099-18]
MARVRSRPTISRSFLGKVLAVFLVVACLLAVASAASSAPPSPRQQTNKDSAAGGAAGSDDLICHTDVAADCYPRVFQPTNEFQRVHEDQDLPPGLHVRLNINTGLREAKINNESEELPAGLQGLPVDSGVVLVDQPEDGINVDTPRIPKGAPAYDPAGVVKDPGAHADGEGSRAAITFHESIALVKGVAVGQVASGDSNSGRNNGQIDLTAAEQSRFLDALVEIDDVAHDMYYGLKLAEDRDITRQLLCLMSGGRVGGDRGVEAAQKAALAVASAVQNNPVALREVAASWDTYKSGECATINRQRATLGDVVFGPYDNGNGAHDDAATANRPAWIRSRLLAISGLIRDKDIMQDFLARGGLTEVLRLLVEREGDAAYDAVRQRAANLVNDNFLDVSMGADLSLWPVKAFAVAAAETSCSDGTVHAHCWDHHIQQLAKSHRKDKSHWSHGLWKGLQDITKSSSGKSEL